MCKTEHRRQYLADTAVARLSAADLAMIVAALEELKSAFTRED